MGPYLSSPVTNKTTTTGSAGEIAFTATGMQGWRNGMEDAHVAQLNVEPGVHVFGVFDGHGGKEVSIFVSRHFVQALVANQNYMQKKMQPALEETFLGLDQMLLTPEGLSEIQEISGVSSSTADAGNIMAGTTSVVALIDNQTLYVANAGDSRCVLNRGGRAMAMSEDHKPENQIERDRIIKAGCIIIEGRVNGNINLSRSIGDLEYKTNRGLPQKDQAVTAFPDVKSMQLTAQDEFLVLACDGIWDVLSNQECVDFIQQRIRAGKPLQQISEEVCDRCLAADVVSSQGIGCDNMTILIVALK